MMDRTVQDTLGVDRYDAMVRELNKFLDTSDRNSLTPYDFFFAGVFASGVCPADEEIEQIEIEEWEEEGGDDE